MRIRKRIAMNLIKEQKPIKNNLNNSSKKMKMKHKIYKNNPKKKKKRTK